MKRRFAAAGLVACLLVAAQAPAARAAAAVLGSGARSAAPLPGFAAPAASASAGAELPAAAGLLPLSSLQPAADLASNSPAAETPASPAEAVAPLPVLAAETALAPALERYRPSAESPLPARGAARSMSARAEAVEIKNDGLGRVGSVARLRALRGSYELGVAPPRRGWLDELFIGARPRGADDGVAHNAFWPEDYPSPGGGDGGVGRRQPGPGQEGAPAPVPAEDADPGPDFQREPVSKIVSDLRAQLAADPAAGRAAAIGLLADAGERRYEVRISAVRALAGLEDAAAAAALAAEVRGGKNWAVRREAALALARKAEALGDVRPAALEALSAASADSNVSLRRAAALAMRALGEPDVPEPEPGVSAPEEPAEAWTSRIGGGVKLVLRSVLWWAGLAAILTVGYLVIQALHLGPIALALFFTFGPIVLMVWLMYWLQTRQMRIQAPEKKQFDMKGEKSAVRFMDVGGIDDASNELREIVDFLRNPEKYASRGAQMPRGVLLEGPPGTGKTLLAKAVAGEAGVPFFSVSASEFVEMFVGVGASRVRDIFKQAKDNGPAILFIDELDAVAKTRGGMDSNSEREQTLNQILTEMDGFEKETGVIVMAATNRINDLDPAILRPGRFDRKIYVGRPDVLGREAVLQIHARGVDLGSDVDLREVASRTPGLAGADLKNVVNEAAIMSVRRDAEHVGQQDFRLAIDRAEVGQKRHLFLSPALKKRIAYHEAGHVMGTVFHAKGQIPHKVTIIPHGSGALGYAQSGSEEEDQFLYTKSELLEQLAVFMGGLVAEELIFGEWSTGPGSDLERATDIARMMVASLGMGETNGLLVTHKDRPSFGPSEVSEQTKREVDLDVRRILDKAKAEAYAVMTQHRAAFEALANALLEKETLHREEIEATLKPHRN